MSTHSQPRENRSVKNYFAKLQSNERLFAFALFGVVALVVVVIVFARGGSNDSEVSLCELAANDTSALLADEENDVAVIADRLRERATFIESAGSGQDSPVSAALKVVAESLREFANATEADDGGKQLQDVTSELTNNDELRSAQTTIDDAVALQCESPLVETTSSSSAVPGP